MAPSHVLVTWALLTATIRAEAGGGEGGGGGAPLGNPPWAALTPNGASGKPRTAPHESQRAQRHRVTPYQQTVPYVVAGSERHRLDRALQDGFPISLQCTIGMEGSSFVLELERNENLLPGTHRLMYYRPDGSLVTEEDRNMTNCYYHGSVHGFADSRVSVSLCSGMRGLVVLARNQNYGIEPLSGDRNGLHLVHRIEGIHFNRKRCAVSHQLPEHSTRQEDQPDLHRSKRDILIETRYIELVMVADNKEFRNTGYDLKTLQMRLLEIANQVDAFYRPLNVRVALVGVEVWTDKDPIEIVKSPGETLNRFLKWREMDLLPRLRHDNAQLLIGGSFTGGTVGMASQSSMCSKDRSGGVNVDHSVSVLGVASTVAHELGHNLGISHDTDDRNCSCQYPKRQGGCIMEPSTGFLPGQAFSSCSRDDLERSLRRGAAMCVFDFPAASRLFGGRRCGNLYVEEGEECDCGLLDECDDPCCNATSCKLLPGAECSSQGTCCSSCKLKRAATVCRPPLGDCDLPEYCTGVSPYCPPNVFLKNGHSCDDGRAYCYNGACLTFEGQCQVLWGPGSVQAHDICFTTVNKKGNKYGNCGRLADGTYVSCTEGDAKCGKIQCQGGNDRPILGSNAEILVTNIKLGLHEHSCRGTFFNFGEDIADPGLVMPGTVCGHRKACVNRTCQDISMFRVEECLRNCNSHGVCNSNENCHCDVGWAPPDCKDTGYGGSIDSGPVQDARGHSTLLAALLVPLLLILLVGFAISYRKREWLRAELRQLGKASSPRHRDSRVENGTRSRTVGGLRYKPPECIQQADLCPPNPAKHVPQLLLRPPPPTKPLPPGPVVNVCQPRRQAPPGRPPPPLVDLPADPTPKGGNQPLPMKPPPPKKPLPSDPNSQLVSMRRLEQPDHVARRSGPSPRPAPPPPPGKKPPPLPPLPLAEV